MPDEVNEFVIEVKYLEAAIEGLCLNRPEPEQRYIRMCGAAIINVAVQTKEIYEKNRKT